LIAKSLSFYVIENQGELSSMPKLQHTTITTDAGATIHEGAFVHSTAIIEEGATIFPMTYIGAHCTIGKNAQIHPFSTILNGAIIGEAATVMHSHIDASVVGARCLVGPFAHMRNNSVLAENIKIGNFVETKNTHIGKDSFVSHLSYLGDAEIGENVNVGAGTITANFNSISGAKCTTTIEDGASLGANSVLVAPVTVGKNAYVGAATVVTEDVPENALAVGRSKPFIKEGWVTQQKEKLQQLEKN